MSKEYESALDCWNKMIEINPNNLRAWTDKGNVLRKLGKLEEALACFDHVLEIDPKNEWALQNKAWTLESIATYKSSKKKAMEENGNANVKVFQILPNYNKDSDIEIKNKLTHLILFKEIIEKLINEGDGNVRYPKETEQMMKLLKKYGLLKEKKD